MKPGVGACASLRRPKPGARRRRGSIKATAEELASMAESGATGHSPTLWLLAGVGFCVWMLAR